MLAAYQGVFGLSPGYLRKIGLESAGLYLGLALCLGVVLWEWSGLMFDVILSGATLFDGSGSLPYQADVGLVGERIAGLGDLSRAEAGQRLDLTGQWLCPGFIDIHTHYDLCVGWAGLGAHCWRQGVTTVVGGNCGMGPEDVGEHLARVELANPGLRYGILASHGPLRSRVCQRSDGRAALAGEQRAIADEVRRALDHGALGLSFGPYHANTLADEAELVAATGALAESGRPFVVHRRCEGVDHLAATREALRIARASGVRLHISHLKVAGRQNWGGFEALLGELEAARHEQDWSFDVYPYDGSLTYLAALLPVAAKADGRLAERLASASERKILKQAIETWFRERQGPEDIIVFARHMPELLGARTLSAAAATLNISDPAEAALAIIAADPQLGGGWAAYRFMMSEVHVQALCGRDDAIIASDAVPEIDGMAAETHPRAYSTFARALSLGGREPAALARVVSRMTSQAAHVYGLKNVGQLLVGFAADLVAIDPDKLADQASYESPACYPLGITEVFVAGCHTLSGGVPTGNQRTVVLRG